MFQQGFEKLQPGGEGQDGSQEGGLRGRSVVPSGVLPHLHPRPDMDQGSLGPPPGAEEMGAVMTV